jgi:hypothetical protein
MKLLYIRQYRNAAKHIFRTLQWSPPPAILYRLNVAESRLYPRHSVRFVIFSVLITSPCITASCPPELSANILYTPKNYTLQRSTTCSKQINLIVGHSVQPQLFTSSLPTGYVITQCIRQWLRYTTATGLPWFPASYVLRSKKKCLDASVHMEQLGSHWKDFHENWCLRIFIKTYVWNFFLNCREKSRLIKIWKE